MNKKDEQLRGGLNALFGGGEEKTQAPTEQTAAPTEEQNQEDSLMNSIEDEELRAALRQRQMKGRGRPKKGEPTPTESLRYTRMCAVVDKVKYEKMREISLRESLQIKEVLEAAMDLAIATYEAKNGKIELAPRKRGKVSDLFK